MVSASSVVEKEDTTPWIRAIARMVSFAESVFYTFTSFKIVSVWSIIDRAAIEAQLAD